MKYWKNLDHKEGKLEELADKEFLTPPAENKPVVDPDRRKFLKLMGAFTALTGMAACTRRPIEKIIPYVEQPKDLIPGVANGYSSTCMECPSACGVLVKTREGRPIKVDGNPDHPMNQGKLCSRGQASVLNLYDPSRLKKPLKDGKTIPWNELDSAVAMMMNDTRVRKVRVLTGALTGPATLSVIQSFLRKFASAKHVVYEAVDYSPTIKANKDSYGTASMPQVRIDRADMLVSFSCDFLGTWISPVEFARQFASRRKPNGKKEMSKFVAFESNVTMTGTNADTRVPLEPGEEVSIALAIAHELLFVKGVSAYAGNIPLQNFLNEYSIQNVSIQTGVDAKILKQLASDLWKHKGRSLVLGGNDYNLQVAVNFLNTLLLNDGVSVDASTPTLQASASQAAMDELITELNRGEVDLLVVSGVDPVSQMAATAEFGKAMRKAGVSLVLSEHLSATAKLANYVAPLSHSLETWGDAEIKKGLYSLVQPTIEPLHGTRSLPEAILIWNAMQSGSGATSWYDELRKTWKTKIYLKDYPERTFEAFWEKSLKSGVYDSTNSFPQKDQNRMHPVRSFAAHRLRALELTSPSKTDLNLVLYPSVSHFDGRAAHNSWLSELPDPVSKICWGNYFAISAKRAKKESLSEGDLIRVMGKTGSASGSVHIQAGLRENVVAAAIGYGELNGFSTAALMGSATVRLEKTGKVEHLASVAGHPSPEGRDIVHEMNLSEVQEGKQVSKHEEHPSMWPGFKYEGHKWGMSIDLNTCIGCSGCMIACQSENNIPPVGKKEVQMGRELSWIQIQTYHTGEEENPDFVHQPMLCQHCDNAPCETVCPTLATVHNDEGLNVQVYNRCVGTRYCSNNCPYKVRRFNWYEYSKDLEKPLDMVLNPDVTVREKGVMEKCSFCHHRIAEAKAEVKRLGIKMPDGFFQTACQQGCPTDAISFGDLNDPKSRVAQLSKDGRSYHVLEELNVKPNVNYLAKVKNRG